MAGLRVGSFFIFLKITSSSLIDDCRQTSGFDKTIFVLSLNIYKNTSLQTCPSNTDAREVVVDLNSNIDTLHYILCSNENVTGIIVCQN